MTDIMGGFGVDSSLPLQAGRGVQSNPLESVGNFARTLGAIQQTQLFPGQLTLQQQAVQGGAATLAKHLSQVGASMLLPSLSNPNFSMEDLTHAAGAAEQAGGSSHGVLGILGAIPFAPNTPEWRTAVRQGVASLAQTNPTEAVAQIAGAPAEQATANGIVAGVRAPAVAGGGFSPATTTPMGLAPARDKRPATAEDVAANPSLTLGQPIFTVLPGVGGNPPAPAPGNSGGNLGSGGYRPPQRPLNQLAPAYTPPGGAAPAAPGGPPPRVAPPGSVVMHGPGGTFMVPPDKIDTFKKAGYQ